MSGNCAVCSGHTGLEVPPFTGSQDDDTPRFVKGRDKAEWKGRGRSTGSAGSRIEGKAAASGSYRGPWQGKSAWAQENRLRNFSDLPASAQAAVLASRDEVRKKIIALTFSGVPSPTFSPAGKRYDCDTRLSPPKNRAPAIPDGVIPSKWNIHHSGKAHMSVTSAHQKGAKNPGRTATRAHFRSRT